MRRLFAGILLIVAMCDFVYAAEPITGTVTIPVVTGRTDRQPFVGHPGWVDVYRHGSRQAASARIRSDATFSLPHLEGPATLIAYFDKMETPPVILPSWPLKQGDYEVPIAVEYACVPPGYPQVWDDELMVRGRNFWQSFVAGYWRNTPWAMRTEDERHLYGCSVFDGPRIVWWGNKVNVSVHRDGAHGEPIVIARTKDDESTIRVSAGHSDHEMPRIGWRHGDIPLEVGRKYAICVGGYRPHGGNQFELDAFVRPDRGKGYAPGEAQNHRTRTGGDLCFLLFGSGNGQFVENQIRTEEWEIFIPERPPARNWGQAFRAYGTALAGVSFWGSNGSSAPVTCEVRIREDGPEGRQIGPVKVARGHDSPDRPIIRYPEIPAPLKGFESYYRLPSDFFQVAYAPSEIPLSPGKKYYIELTPSEPLMMYADGDYYDRGFAHYKGEKIDRLPRGRTFHSRSWTLAMNIVTYEKAKPPSTIPRPPAGSDGNLIVNGGAETGDFSWWRIGSDPDIDPTTHIPDPPNHGGDHRFGISAGWTKANMFQYQEVPNITPDAAYRAGFWASHQDGTDESAELLWCDGSFGGDEHLLAQTEKEADSRWKHYEGPAFKPTQSTATIIIRYRHTRPTGIASIHVDDVYLKAVKESGGR